MKLFYSKRRFLKKFLRACITLFMSVSIVCCSVFAPAVSSPVRVEASGVAFGKIATYILSAIGALNIGTGGRVSKVSGSKFDGLVEMVSDAFGTGVYQDSSGNYVFSNEFSQNVLSYLDGQSSINYRVISDFSAPSDWNGIWENSGNVPPAVTQHFPAFKNEFDKYLICSYYNSNFYFGSYTLIGSGMVVWDMSDVAFIAPGSSSGYTSWYQFYDKNFNMIFPDHYLIGGCKYSNSYYSSTNPWYWYNQYGMCSCASGIYYESGNYYPRVIPETLSVNNTNFINLPYCVFDNTAHFELYSNRSIIFCTDAGIAANVLNKDSGVFINNYYNTIPSVTNKSLEQNDWDVVYNNYITNVSNSYNIENGTDQPFDQNKLRKWMSKYSEQIIDAINNGSTDIAEQLNYTNEWLNKIYTKLSIIEGLLASSNSGSSAVVSGGSSSWSDNDVSTILSDVNNIRSLLSDNNTYLLSLQRRIDTTNDTLSGASAILNSINTNTYNSVTQLQNLYTLLSNVYTAILNIDSGGGGGGGSVVPLPDSDPYSDWFEVLHNIPQVDLDDIFNKFDVLKAVLQNTAPFVMLGIITVTLNSFKAEPVAPEFSIPVKLQNDIIDIDESIELDLSVMDTLIPLLRDLILILWTIGLLMFAWWLIPKIYIIIN